MKPAQMTRRIAIPKDAARNTRTVRAYFSGTSHTDIMRNGRITIIVPARVMRASDVHSKKNCLRYRLSSSFGVKDTPPGCMSHVTLTLDEAAAAADADGTMCIDDGITFPTAQWDGEESVKLLAAAAADDDVDELITLLGNTSPGTLVGERKNASSLLSLLGYTLLDILLLR